MSDDRTSLAEVRKAERDSVVAKLLSIAGVAGFELDVLSTELHGIDRRKGEPDEEFRIRMRDPLEARGAKPTDDRPSIAELQSLIESKDRIDEFETTCKRMQRAHSLIFRVCQQARVAPVILEIAAAALVRRDTECTCGAELGCFPDCARQVAENALLAALAKVQS